MEGSDNEKKEEIPEIFRFVVDIYADNRIPDSDRRLEARGRIMNVKGVKRVSP